LGCSLDLQKEVGQGLLPSGAVIVDLLRQVGTGQTGVGIVGERAGVGSNDALTNNLAGMSKHQLYEVMVQMKMLIQQNQQQARQVFIANPQLTKALFQIRPVAAHSSAVPGQPQRTTQLQQFSLQPIPAQQQLRAQPPFQVSCKSSDQGFISHQPEAMCPTLFLVNSQV
ncbi:unnamed protein product, partial [Sphagnum jensenii]